MSNDKKVSHFSLLFYRNAWLLEEAEVGGAGCNEASRGSPQPSRWSRQQCVSGRQCGGELWRARGPHLLRPSAAESTHDALLILTGMSPRLNKTCFSEVLVQIRFKTYMRIFCWITVNSRLSAELRGKKTVHDRLCR